MATLDITERDIAAYERDGVVCLRQVFTPECVELVREGIEKDIEAPGPLHTMQNAPGEPGYFLTDFCMAQRLQEFRRFVFDSPASEIAARLMRSSRVNFFYDGLWVKDRGTPKRTRWHQDQPYYPVDGEHMCILWMPLDPVTKDVCLELIRGSHRWNRWFQPELTRSGKDLYPPNAAFERMPDIEAERARHDIATFDMEPGDCIAFQGLVVHGAPGNARQAHQRRALSTIWLGDDATFVERPGPVRPLFEGHGLKPGDSMDSPYFPRTWPRVSERDGARAKRFADGAFRISI
ncbi:MAG: phytanoyl-CoA dioxygenase family protein [Alphaproteobacteria bacterium]